MTKLQKDKILILKQKGKTYREIADELNIGIGAIKMFISRQLPVKPLNCPHCQETLMPSSQPTRKFCSDKCRMAYYYQTHKAVGK